MIFYQFIAYHCPTQISVVHCPCNVNLHNSKVKSLDTLLTLDRKINNTPPTHFLADSTHLVSDLMSACTHTLKVLTAVVSICRTMLCAAD